MLEGGYMVNIITDSSLLSDFDYIFDNFNSFVISFVSIKDFTDLDKYVLEKIDNAVIKDVKTDAVETKYGVTSITNVSSGCKVVLTYLYYKRNQERYDGTVVFNVNECGWNALDVLFELASKLNDDKTCFYLCHQDKIYNCKERSYLINKSRKISNLIFI